MENTQDDSGISRLEQQLSQPAVKEKVGERLYLLETLGKNNGALSAAHDSPSISLSLSLFYAGAYLFQNCLSARSILHSIF